MIREEIQLGIGGGDENVPLGEGSNGVANGEKKAIKQAKQSSSMSSADVAIRVADDDNDDD